MVIKEMKINKNLMSEPNQARRNTLKRAATLAFGLTAVAATNAHAFLGTGVEKTPVNVAPLTIVVPADQNILRTSTQGLIRDVGAQGHWVNQVRDGVHMGYAVQNERPNGTEFVVHARVSNGTAGSG
jgi:hypothetical protein